MSWKLLAAAIVLCLNVAAPAVGQDEAQVRKLDDATFMEMEAIGSVSISPSGEKILFSRTWIDQTADQSRSNFWIADFDGGRVRELTPGNWRDTNPVWSPAGDKIAFLSDRDGTTQLHVMWLDTREVAQLTHVERAPGGLAWSPDGSQIAFEMFVPKTEPPLKVKLPPRPRGAKWAEGEILVDRLTWQRDGSGYLPPGFRHLFTIDAILGGTPRQVTSGDYDHSGAEWSRDGKSLLFSAIRKEDAEYLRGDSEIYRVDLDTLEVTALTDRSGPDGNPLASPDGKWIVYSGFDQQEFTMHLSSIYLMDADGSNKRLLAGDLPASPGNLQWADDSSGVYFEVDQHGARNLHFVGVEGQADQLTQGAHVLGSISIAKNGRAAAIRSDFHQPGELVAFDVADPATLTSLVDVNRDVLDGVELGAAEELWF